MSGVGRWSVVAALLTWLFCLVLAAPVAVGILSLACCEQYRIVAFGLYRRTARGVQMALAILLAYYLAILAWSFQSGTLAGIAQTPASPGANLLLSQAVLAIAAFGALAYTARSMCAMTEPARRPALRETPAGGDSVRPSS